MNLMKSKRELIKCEKCEKNLIFDEQLVEEIEGKIYCKNCAQKLKLVGIK